MLFPLFLVKLFYKSTNEFNESLINYFLYFLGMDGKRVIIFGGFGIDSKDALYVLDITNFEWEVPYIVGKIPESRYWHKANVFAGYMIVTFGKLYQRVLVGK